MDSQYQVSAEHCSEKMEFSSNMSFTEFLSYNEALEKEIAPVFGKNVEPLAFMKAMGAFDLVIPSKKMEGVHAEVRENGKQSGAERLFPELVRHNTFQWFDKCILVLQCEAMLMRDIAKVFVEIKGILDVQWQKKRAKTFPHSVSSPSLIVNGTNQLGLFQPPTMDVNHNSRKIRGWTNSMYSDGGCIIENDFQLMSSKKTGNFETDAIPDLDDSEPEDLEVGPSTAQIAHTNDVAQAAPPTFAAAALSMSPTRQEFENLHINLKTHAQHETGDDTPPQLPPRKRLNQPETTAEGQTGEQSTQNHGRSFENDGPVFPVCCGGQFTRHGRSLDLPKQSLTLEGGKMDDKRRSSSGDTDAEKKRSGEKERRNEERKLAEHWYEEAERKIWDAEDMDERRREVVKSHGREGTRGEVRLVWGEEEEGGVRRDEGRSYGRDERVRDKGRNKTREEKQRADRDYDTLEYGRNEERNLTREEREKGKKDFETGNRNYGREERIFGRKERQRADRDYDTLEYGRSEERNLAREERVLIGDRNYGREERILGRKERERVEGRIYRRENREKDDGREDSGSEEEKFYEREGRREHERINQCRREEMGRIDWMHFGTGDKERRSYLREERERGEFRNCGGEERTGDKGRNLDNEKSGERAREEKMWKRIPSRERTGIFQVKGERREVEGMEVRRLQGTCWYSTTEDTEVKTQQRHVCNDLWKNMSKEPQTASVLLPTSVQRDMPLLRPKHGKEYDFSQEETEHQLRLCQGWNSNVTENQVNEKLKQLCREDGHFVIFYWEEKKRPAICVTFESTVNAFTLHKRQDREEISLPEYEREVKYYYIFPGQFKSQSMKELVNHYLDNGLVDKYSKKNPKPCLRFTKPVILASTV